MQVTVPHSGTRFIETSFGNAGFTTDHWKSYVKNNTKPQFLWAHFNPLWWDEIKGVANQVPNLMVPLRDPVATLGTHWKSLEKETPENRDAYYNQRLERLNAAWKLQNKFIDEFDPFIFRVDKDPLVALSSWSGVGLVEGERYATSYPLKELIEARDVEGIKALTKTTDYWRAFVEDLTPIFRDLYKEHNYDLWWDNG